MEINYYGNVDISKGIPDNCIYVDQRIQSQLRKLNIPFYPAFHGYRKLQGTKYAPVVRGIVISKEYEKEVEGCIEELKQRAQKRQERKENAHRKINKVKCARDLLERCFNL